MKFWKNSNMKKLIALLPLFIITNLFAQYTENDIWKYIDTYKELAIRKMYEYKIPASITLAQGIFESACGTSRLATVAKNHFGIKCHKEWTGDTIQVDDDAIGECFRVYESVEESYNDHSLFLTSRSRYNDLFTLDIMDYRAWAKGLKAAGYATNPKYPERLISLIQRFNIAQWDTVYQQRLESGYFTNPQPKPEVVETKPAAKPNTPAQKNETSFAVFVPELSSLKPVEYPFTYRTVYENNRTFFVVATKDDTYASIARDVQLKEKKLVQYNDALGKQRKLQEGEAIYIEKKEYANPIGQHIVKKGETLRFISQKYGIRLSSLLSMNGLTESSIIRPNDVIKLSNK